MKKIMFVILLVLILVISACSNKSTTTEPIIIDSSKADSLYCIYHTNYQKYKLTFEIIPEGLKLVLMKNLPLKDSYQYEGNVSIVINQVRYLLESEGHGYFSKVLPLTYLPGNTISYSLRVDINDPNNNFTLHKTYNSAIKLAYPIEIVSPDSLTTPNQEYHISWTSQGVNQYQVIDALSCEQGIDGGPVIGRVASLSPDARQFVVSSNYVETYDTDYDFRILIAGFNYVDLGEISVFSINSQGLYKSIIVN